MPKKIGFVFSSKERPEYSRHSLQSIDQDSGFDLIWLDGSDSPEARALPAQTRLAHGRIIEAHQGVKGGPDKAIQFGLRRLLKLGYDYCGLLENDIELSPGWLQSLLEAWQRAEADDLRVGAVTARTLQCRVLAATPRYALMWNMGAGNVLFSRLGAQIVLSRYRLRSAREIQAFYAERMGCDLRDRWELFMDKPDRALGMDWGYALELYRCGLATVGTVPARAVNFDCDLEKELRTEYQKEIGNVAAALPSAQLTGLAQRCRPALCDRLRRQSIQTRDLFFRLLRFQ